MNSIIEVPARKTMARRTGQTIGFSQRVRLEWLEKTANMVLAGCDRAAVNAALNDILKKDEVPECNRDKVISILRKVWVTTPQELIPLRNDALDFLCNQSTTLSPNQLSVVVHWGMVMAVYPFWSAVAAPTGRLLRLQGSVAEDHVQRRVREQYGERDTVFQATRHVLRSYLDWGVLQETGTKGIYHAGETLTVDDPRLIAWLAEASLHARANGPALLNDLTGSPGLFPFHIKPVHAVNLMDASPRLDVVPNGLDGHLVMLRKQTVK